MKKFFALTLAVVMVLSIASSAMAFSWGKPADKTADDFANRYKIEVVKLANETGIIGTNKLIEAPGATAVNNASVYFYIRLTVSGASVKAGVADDPDAVQANAKADVSFTALQGLGGGSYAALTNQSGVELKDLANGVYYFDRSAAASTDGKVVFQLITGTLTNSDFSKAAIEARVLDTATAKAYAKVSSKRALKPYPSIFNYGSYDILVDASIVSFYEAVNPIPAAASPDATKLVATFKRDGNGKVTEVVAGADGQKVAALYQWLNAGSADAIHAAISKGEMYMTDDNIRAAFGFDYKGESSITWNANATAIILDPAIGVGIPKTGDNASVIGFAMVMIAVVGAAVAVKKVRA